MGREWNDAERDGIRKAALFLSILDEKATETLLARFEPDVARAIEEEAKTVGSVAADDVDAIVAEFLALSETADEPNAGENFERAAWASREKKEKGENEEKEEKESGERTAEKKEAALGLDAFWSGGGASDVVDEFQALDAIEPARLARTLSGARASTVAVAVALSRLSARRRAALVSLLPTETVEAAEAALGTLVRTTDAARRLEDALFNGALDDE